MEKPRKSYSLGELKDFMSSAGGEDSTKNDKKFEKIKAKEKKGDDTLKELTLEEKSQYKHFSTYNKGEKAPEEEYTPSEDYFDYKQEQEEDMEVGPRRAVDRMLAREKKNKTEDVEFFKEEEIDADITPSNNKSSIFTNTEKPIPVLTYTSVLHDSTNDDDIINPSPMSAENIKINTTLSPSSEKVGPGQQLKNLEAIATRPLSNQDLKIRDNVYEYIDFWKKILNKKYGDKAKDERNKRDLIEFNLSPYGWTKMATEISIKKKEREFEQAQNEFDRSRIRKIIERNLEQLNNLDLAFKKNIPLKLERNFNAKKIVLDNGSVFNVEQVTEELNERLGEKHNSYEITGIVQRRNNDYLVLRTDDGKDIEINISTIKYNSKDSLVQKEKEEKFKSIKKDSIIRVRVGGLKEPTSVYKITALSKDKVTFENLTLRRKDSMSLENMKKFLFGPKVEFILEEAKGARNKSEPVMKDATPEAVVEENTLSRVGEVVSLEKELGLKINTPSIIKRYLKVSIEESQALFDEYKKLQDSAEPVPPVAEEAPLEEEPGPVVEEIPVAEETESVIETSIEDKIKEEKLALFEELYKESASERTTDLEELGAFQAEINMLTEKANTLQQEIEIWENEQKNKSIDEGDAMDTEVEKEVDTKVVPEETFSNVDTSIWEVPPRSEITGEPENISQPIELRAEDTGAKKRDMEKNKKSKEDFEYLEKTVKEILGEVWDIKSIKDRGAELSKFRIESNKNDFKIKSTVSINKLGSSNDKKANIDITISLKNDASGELSLGQQTIFGELPSNERKQIELSLTNLVPKIKKYFETRDGEKIKSMRIENGKFIVETE